MKQIFNVYSSFFLHLSKIGYRVHHPPVRSMVDDKYVGKTDDDAFQVSASEYDNNFISRYGLLYLKASNDPFTGRIITVDAGDSGEFVFSDESWEAGGSMARVLKWFSNGIKMYERNYKRRQVAWVCYPLVA